jgi:hypothetical protein
VLTLGTLPVTFYSLNLTPPVGGTVTPGSGPYPVGSTQVLQASAERDYTFAGWEGTTNTAANPLAIVMNRNYQLTARFLPARPTYNFEPPFQAADLTAPPWRNLDASPWQLTEEAAWSGRFAVRSGPIGDGDASTLQFAAPMRAGALTFAVHLSSESGWDFLEFFVNGAKVQRWSGEVGWEIAQFNLPAGQNTLTWRYAKDANFSEGADAAFIDDLYVPLDTPDPTPSAPRLGITLWPGGLTILELSGKAGLTYVVQASPDLNQWTPIATNVLQGSSGFVQDPQPPSPSQRFYRALTP